jgi:hypothetical protein
MDELIEKMTDFIGNIGLHCSFETIEGNTFLPGLKLRNGTLIIDKEKLLYPGDILHEAGHLACMPPEIRKTMSDSLENNDMHSGGEMMAIAWSYAACLHLGIDLNIVFHEGGYKGGAASIVDNFNHGRYFGVPLLQWSGMCYEPAKARELNRKSFPEMTSWVCNKNMYGQNINEYV